MVDAGIEVGIVPDMRRQVQDAVRGAMQQMRARVGPVCQQRADGIAQRSPRPGTHGHEGIERRPDAGMHRGLRFVIQQRIVVQRAQVQNHVTDRDPASRCSGQWREHAKR